jgi:hypothetical protein
MYSRKTCCILWFCVFVWLFVLFAVYMHNHVKRVAVLLLLFVFGVCCVPSLLCMYVCTLTQSVLHVLVFGGLFVLLFRFPSYVYTHAKFVPFVVVLCVLSCVCVFISVILHHGAIP